MEEKIYMKIKELEKEKLSNNESQEIIKELYNIIKDKQNSIKIDENAFKFIKIDNNKKEIIIKKEAKKENNNENDKIENLNKINN